ncbi:MAG: helix-turn-helix transcriptional regulator, partial [Bacteroidota bacterium]
NFVKTLNIQLTPFKMILKKIRIARLEKDYSQEYMADYLGVSQSAYSNLEKGKTKMNLKCLKKISKILDIDLLNEY